MLREEERYGDGLPLVFEAIEAKVPHATDSHPDVQVGKERQLFSRREEVGLHVAERLAALAAVSGEASMSEELLDLGSYESLVTGLVQVSVRLQHLGHRGRVYRTCGIAYVSHGLAFSC